MSEMLTAFGIDWRLLVVNMVNFGLLVAGLWYFLYGPVMRMLEERRQRIADGLQDAQAAAEERAAIELSRASALAAAGQEADAIVGAARAAAGDKQREMIAAAQNTAAAVLKEAELQAEEAKTRAVAESKEEVAKLIVLGMERALNQK